MTPGKTKPLPRLAARGDVLERLERYGELHSDVVKAIGADKFPPLPIRRVA